MNISRLLLDKVIYTEKINCSDNFDYIGFCPSEEAWYGFSYQFDVYQAFRIGSEVTPNSIGYVPSTINELKDQIATYMATIHDERNNFDQELYDKYYYDVFEDLPDGSGIIEKCNPLDDIEIIQVNTVDEAFRTIEDLSVGKLPDSIKGEFNPAIYYTGKGAWVAKTLDDAKQMAIDFAMAMM